MLKQRSCTSRKPRLWKWKTGQKKTTVYRNLLTKWHKKDYCRRLLRLNWMGNIRIETFEAIDWVRKVIKSEIDILEYI